MVLKYINDERSLPGVGVGAPRDGSEGSTGGHDNVCSIKYPLQPFLQMGLTFF
jgi:hypothetical protein